MKLDLGIDYSGQGEVQPARRDRERTDAYRLGSPGFAPGPVENVERAGWDGAFEVGDDRKRKFVLKRAPSRSRRLRETSTNGIASHPKGQHVYRCVLRDISAMGARIALPPGSQLANRMYVIHCTTQTVYDSDVAWFNGSEAGLVFRRAFSLRRLKHPELVFLKKLWSEHARNWAQASV